MLNIANTTEPQALMIPVSETIRPKGRQLTLKLASTMTHERHAVQVTLMPTSDSYYNIALTLPEGMDAGEYDYELSAVEGVLSVGLAIVGDYGRAVYEYVKPVQYEQYEN